MLYHYLASDVSGKIVEADIDADDLNQLLHYLAGKELRPVSVRALQSKKYGTLGVFGKISVTDKVFLTKYLALMLRVGTDLLSAIDILLADFDKPAVRNLLLEIRNNLSRGQQFYRAFEAHRDVFSPTFIALVKAAEKSGNLQNTFEELSKTLSAEADLRSRIRAALIYPAVLITASSVLIGFLVTFAIPKISHVFSDSGIKPPAFSRAVFGVGLIFGKNIIAVVAILAALILFLLYFYYGTKLGRNFFGRIFTKIPFLKGIYTQIAIQRLASTMSSLMKAGLPIIETINVAAETVGTNEFQNSLRRIANEGLAKGLTIGEAFKKETIYPKVVTNLIAISEKAGHLEEVLATLADFYSANIDASIKAAVSLLEPGLLLVMGVIVATIALSIIVPIYQLATNLQQ